MSKLTEMYTKYSKDVQKRSNLAIEAEVIANTNKDNAELQRYIKIQKEIEKINKDEVEFKKDAYVLMEEGGIDLLENDTVIVTLKHPYTKQDFDLKQLLSDAAKNPNDELLQKIIATYVLNKTVKGNVNLKILES